MAEQSASVTRSISSIDRGSEDVPGDSRDIVRPDARSRSGEDRRYHRYSSRRSSSERPLTTTSSPVFERPGSRPWRGAKREYVDRRDAGDDSHASRSTANRYQSNAVARFASSRPMIPTARRAVRGWRRSRSRRRRRCITIPRDIAPSHISDPSG